MSALLKFYSGLTEGVTGTKIFFFPMVYVGSSTLAVVQGD